MQANFDKLIKWVKPPSILKIDSPFIKAKPIRPLENNKILYEVDTNQGKKQIQVLITDSFQMSGDKNTFQDMCHMNILNEPQVLNNLIQRYKEDLIFTYIGPTLIVLNPYKYISDFFDTAPMAKIRQRIITENLDQLEPHVFMIAGKAYLHMKKSDAKQAIVISGESGAGKTQSTKYCMKILTSLSHPDQSVKMQSHSVQSKILSCNPILQAFGNSKTVRNDNSSRFGKYVQMFFGQDNTIKGAAIQSYLLQKSRVVSIAKGERSFHAFYALIASKKYKIQEASVYDFLRQSECYSAGNIDDSKNFKEINDAMSELEFGQQQQNKIWQLLKAILELGNLKFSDKQNKQDEQMPCKITNKQLLKTISQALQINEQNLQKILLMERKVMVGQVMHSAYKIDGCIGHRNTLCKAIYNTIFQFILKKIQVKLNPQDMQNLKSINILDIFGFENFQNNSFQQLCINFTNQKLLKLYNEYIFKRQMELLIQDGLEKDVKNIKPPTNEIIINMIYGAKVSMFSLVNDNTAQQHCTDQNIRAVIQQRLKDTGLVQFNKTKHNLFKIKHSQCEVEYNVTGFKMKNLDKINDDILQIINNFKIVKGEKAKQEKGRTLLKKFAQEIQSLITELSTSNVHFVRCIKPNEIKKPNVPIDSYILSQVRYLGVFQTIQIRKKTFPVRMNYSQFIKLYGILFQNLNLKNQSEKRVSQFILKELKCEKNQFMLGHKRVYINQRIQSVLNKMTYEFYKKRNQQVKKLQEVCKRFIFTSKVSRKLKQIVYRKKIWKKIAQKNKLKLIKHGFQILQTNYQKYKQEQKRLKQAEAKAKKQAEMKAKQAELKSKQSQLKAKQQQQLKKNNKQQFQKKQKQRESKQKNKSNPIRGKQLQQINQKFFKYTRPIVKAYTKLSLGKYFQRLKIIYSKKDVKNKSLSTKNATINQTILVEPPEQNPSIFKLKNAVPKPQVIQQKKTDQQFKFNQSFYNQQSVYISPGADVIFTGNLKIQMFQNNKQNQQKLTHLRTILGEKYNSLYSAQSEVCSPHSEDSNFKIEDTPKQIMSKIINFPIDDFFMRVLRKRTGVFGMKKDYSEILVYKPRPLTKTLTQLQSQEQIHAIKVFKLLIKIGQQTVLDNVFKLVDNVMRYCQQTSQALKNQIFLQLIKQSNNQSEVPAIRIYQTFSVYLHIYTPDEDFVYAALHLFFNKIAQKKHHQKEEQFLRYLFKKMIRKIQKPHGVGYMPIKYQIMALMSKRQISIPIYLPIGNNILVKAESYETFCDVKQKVLEQLGINTNRIPSQFFAFFQVVNYQNTQLEESPVNQNSVIWDVMTYWQLAKQKYQQSGVPPPYFSIMIKIKFPFECSFDDEQAIQLYFAQCYFDYSMGRVRLQLRQMSMLAACIKKIKLPNQSNDDVEGCFPLWMSKTYDKQTFKKYILDNLVWLQQNHLDILTIKYKFLQVCSQSPLSLTFAIPTQHSIKLFLKPKRIYLVEKGNVVGEYSIREIAKWSNNNESFNFEIKKKDGTIQNKTHIIMTEYSHMCTDYLNKVSEYLLKYGGRSQKFSENKILKGV